MSYFKKIIFFLVALFIFIPVSKASEVNIYQFYSELCSTCEAEYEWMSEYYKDNENVNIIRYEVSRDDENALFLEDVREALENNEMTTPYTVIGTMGLTGFSDTVENQIKEAVNKYGEEEHVDLVNVVENDLDVDYEIDYPEGEFSVPVLGEINPKKVSLPLISIIVGFIDGFNPCAMWILLFLISMLFNMKNRRRMWILGFTFLITSALTYLCFMLAWLKVAVSLTSIGWVRLIIGLIALIGGFINLRSYQKDKKDDSGCQVVDDKKRKSMFKRIKKIIANVDETSDNFWKNEKGFILALIGIIGLAVSVNLVELACSSGLPLVFTQILALNDLSSLEYFLYILLYILFFLVDDIVIFVIAMKTLKLTGISTKYNKLSHLIGGIVMLLIGILMIFKPEWIMFNF